MEPNLESDNGRISPIFVTLFFVAIFAAALFFLSMQRKSARSSQVIPQVTALTSTPFVPFSEDRVLVNALIGKKVNNLVELPTGHLIFTFDDFSNLIVQKSGHDMILLKQLFSPDRFDSSGN